MGIAKFSQRKNANQMVVNRRELGGSRLTGQDVETVVELKSVSADDLGSQFLSKANGQIGFANCGRTGQLQVPQFVHEKAKDPRSP